VEFVVFVGWEEFVVVELVILVFEVVVVLLMVVVAVGVLGLVVVTGSRPVVE